MGMIGEESTNAQITAADIEAFNALARKMAFFANPVALDTKSNRKKLNGKAIIADGDKVVTTTELLKKDMLELIASAKSERVLEGRVIGWKPAGSGNLSTNLAIISFGSQTCNVFIPDYALFDYDITEQMSVENNEKIKSRIIKMIGANVKFIVKHFDQKTKTAYADRLKAMASEGYQNYVRKINHTGTTRVKEGDLVEGRVVAVYRNRLVVYSLGSETVIYQDPRYGTDVSWMHLTDLSMMYKADQIVACKVKKVATKEVEKLNKEKYTLIETELSIKECEPNPQLEYFDNYSVDQICECIVTNVNPAANGVHVILNGAGSVDCMVSLPKFGPMPVVGDTRVVRITEMTTKTKSGSEYESDGTPVRRIYGVFIGK